MVVAFSKQRGPWNAERLKTRMPPLLESVHKKGEHQEAPPYFPLFVQNLPVPYLLENIFREGEPQGT